MESQLYTLKDVIALTGYHHATIYRRMKAGRFPKPIKDGCSSRWPKEAFDEWRANLIKRQCE
jgi:prophage regulatory protein